MATTDIKPEVDEAAAAEIECRCMFGDEESDHQTADEILCTLLENLGFPKTVAAWRKVAKWYA